MIECKYKQEDELYSWMYQHGYNGVACSQLFDFVGKEKLLACQRILDAGCGTQSFARELAGIDYQGDIIGIDICDYIARQKIHSCNVIHASLEDIPFPDNHFDGLFCSDVLEHISQDDNKLINSLKELRRVLASDGLWAFSICCVPCIQKGPNKEELHATVKPANWWVKTLKKAGFADIQRQIERIKWPKSLYLYGK